MKKNNNWILPVAFIIFIIFWKFISNEEPVPNPKIEIYNSSIESIIDFSSEIEVLADSISLPEGPVWDSNSKSLLFVDVMGNKLYKWNETDGASEYISPSGNTGYAPNVDFGLLGANGLAINSNGDIVVCQHGDRRVALIENSPSTNPNFVTVVDNFEGKKFNSPNDLVYASDGSFYFTDPAFGFFNLETFQFVEDEVKNLDFNGVYKFNPSDNKLSLVTKEIDLPNGIGLSPDNNTLYVNKMGLLDGNPRIISLNLETNESSILFDGKELSESYEGNFDGMTVHSSGNIFTSGPGGLLVISPEGDLMAKIDFGHLTNATFNDDESYLYVTGFVNNPKVFRIKLK
jgi:gluconolactonase